MNRNWDIMRNSANGADPTGTTRRMEQNRMRSRERFTSRDRQEGFGGASMFDGRHIADYGHAAYGRDRYREQDEGRGWGHDQHYRTNEGRSGMLGNMEHN